MLILASLPLSRCILPFSLYATRGWFSTIAPTTKELRTWAEIVEREIMCRSLIGLSCSDQVHSSDPAVRLQVNADVCYIIGYTVTYRQRKAVRIESVRRESIPNTTISDLRPDGVWGTQKRYIGSDKRSIGRQ